MISEFIVSVGAHLVNVILTVALLYISVKFGTKTGFAPSWVYFIIGFTLLVVSRSIILFSDFDPYDNFYYLGLVVTAAGIVFELLGVYKLSREFNKLVNK